MPSACSIASFHGSRHRLVRSALAATLYLLASGCDLGLSIDEQDSCKPLAATSATLLANGQLDVTKPLDFCDTVLPRQYKLFQFTDVPGLIADIDGYDGEWTFPSDVLTRRLDSGSTEVRWGLTAGKACGRRWNSCTPKGEFVCVDMKMPAHNVWTPLPVESSVFDRGPAVALVGGDIYVLRPLNRSEVWKGNPKTGEFELVTKDFLPLPQLEAETASAGVAIGHGTDLWFLADKRKFRFDTVAKKWHDEGTLSEAVTRYSYGFAFGGKLYIARNSKNVPNPGDGPMMRFDPADGSLVKFGGPKAFVRAVAFVRDGRPVFGPMPVCPTGSPPCYDNGFVALDVGTLQMTEEPYHLPAAGIATVAFDFEDFDIVGTDQGRMFRIDAKTAAVTEITALGNLGCAGKQIHRTAPLAGAITAAGAGWVFGGEGDMYGLYSYVP
jgi:hypothetical protein